MDSDVFDNELLHSFAVHTVLLSIWAVSSSPNNADVRFDDPGIIYMSFSFVLFNSNTAPITALLNASCDVK